MSVTSQVAALAAAIRDKLNAMTPRLIPTGGAAGQHLVKASNVNYAMAWADAPDPLDLTETDVDAPPANTVRLFRRSIANRQLPAFIGPSDLDSALQPLLACNKVGYWCPPGNSTTVPGVFGFTPYTVSGSATARNIATSNMFQRMRRLGFVSSTLSGNFAGARVAVAQVTTGTAIGGIGVGGFFKVIRFGISDATLVGVARMFVGVGSANAPSNVDPATLTNSIGIGCNANDTNFKLYYGGSAAQTPINLGANFPCNSTNTDVYELALFCPPGSTTIHWQVTRLNTGHIASGSLTGTAGTQVPSSSTLLSYSQAWRCNNTAFSPVGIDIFSDYIETVQ